MIWFNKDKTACLNTSLIAFWTFKNGELNVYIGSTDPIVFNGTDAEEIYNMLTLRKEIL